MITEKSLIKEFLDSGWIITLIGGVAMLMRILAGSKRASIITHIRNILAAAIASTLCWFVLEQTDIPSLYKAITYGVVGVITPEIINGIIKLGRRFEKDPITILKKQ